MKKREEIVGIVLAAGLSSRMGKFKQLLPIDDEPAVCKIAGVLKQCLERVIVVVGYRADEVRDALAELEVECLLNREFRDGMLSSVQCAVREIGPDRDYLFCLGDQPSINGDIVQGVIDRALGLDAGIVIPTFDGKRGHPLFLSRSYRSEILKLGREVGLNVITHSNPHDTVEVPLAYAEILDDMDTPADYAREKARAKRD